jgi:cyanophycinase-like exopeptidase
MTPTLPRILCIMGSGETAPTMVSVHADLMQRVGSPPAAAVMLDTPFGFQENADDVSARAIEYFRTNVGAPIGIASFRSREEASPRMYEAMLAAVADASYVFAGPGSPTYALQQWRDTELPALLQRKLHGGGCVTFASAAAVGIGRFSLPVYEVYKVGAAPHWNEGIDLLAATGLSACVIPHYNNAEGGTHDTRYCYMGERRLRALEAMLPGDVDVLGVDEHTACIFDLDAGTVTVRGRGTVTWRHREHSRRFDAGGPIPIAELSTPSGEYVSTQAATTVAATAPAQADGAGSPFLEEVDRQAGIAESALQRRDVDAAVEALLAIDTQMHDWASDTLDSDEQDRARAVLRRQVVRLGAMAHEGASDPRARIAPVVDRLLTLRHDLRADGQYAVADRVRDALVDAGIAVHDTPDGTSWDLLEATAVR